MKTISIDIESYSSVDLTKSGAFKYAESPDFEIILFGYSVDGGEVQVVDIASGETIPTDIIEALTDDNVKKWAFNAAFERICLSKWLGLPIGQYLNPESWRCSMVWAAYLGLPLSLAGVGAVLGLEKQKMTEGKDYIRYFCQPCKPTQTNSGRSRNRPADSPEKWSQFKAYNVRDVETEMSIQARLAKFPVPEGIWAEYLQDQEINDRGVLLDMTLVKNAIAADERSRSELLTKMRQLTELENPNSVTQIRDWLSQNGLETDTLGKKAVAELLKTAPAPLVEVLSLRQQLAKSSVKKYQAMETVVCADNRARGLFQYYGANRTGRAAGRLIQCQNLPQNHMADLEQARRLVRSGDFATLNLLYDNVPEVLSELIRTAIVPKDGCKFIVADFASIEAVVLAWLAGEKWTLEAYSEKRDLYIENAEMMFGVPKGSIDKKSPLRQKSKIAVLACISEGQLVLTDRGLVPIEDVTLQHRLWDGQSWVTHEGVIYKGYREVIEYDGLVATPDHMVWIEGQSEPIQFGIAAARKAHLLQAGDGWRAIRVGENYKSGKAVDGRQNDTMLCSHAMPGMWSNTVDPSEKSDAGHIGGMSKLLTAEENTIVARQTINCCKTAVRKSKRCKLSSLWLKRYKVRLCKCYRRRTVLNKCVRIAEQENGNRQDRQQRKLREGQYPFCYTFREQLKQAWHRALAVGARVLALQLSSRNTQAVTRVESGANHSRCEDSGIRKEEELANHQRMARLYDIRNAGNHHRFTVSGKLVHNCGYSGSVGALKAFGALEMGLKAEELKPLVDAWRAANPSVVRFWWDADKAAKTAVKEKKLTETHGIRFSYQSNMLFITLPSGRRLAYVKPRIGENRFGSECVTYEGIGATKKWERIESSPGKWVENITQAVARDILYFALSAFRSANVVMHIHDEVVIEVDKHVSPFIVCEQMSRVPPWANGIPLRCDGYETPFYKKD